MPPESFPVCKHRRLQVPLHGLRWLASEPFRLFFVSGGLWSIIGVMLWPLFYAKWLGFYPSVAHSRLMIEAFGGAFVIGFLGTAGPRMASAPRLTPVELAWLFMLHQASALCHLSMRSAVGDALFALLLASLAACLGIRLARYAKEPPPAAMRLAFCGLAAGMVGAALLAMDSTHLHIGTLRLAQVLLFQGLLLMPVLGIGSFLFPRMLGGEFGEDRTNSARKMSQRRTDAAAVLLLGSMALEAAGHESVAYSLRTLVCVVYMLLSVDWRYPRPAARVGGTLIWGLKVALCIGVLGLVLVAVQPEQRVSLTHLLYVGGFGMLMLVVGSRVLFGHSGELQGFQQKGGVARWVIGLSLLAALTRAAPAWAPSITLSHHIYAACLWALACGIWLAWHHPRFGKKPVSE